MINEKWFNTMDVRQRNLYNNLNKILEDDEIKVLCFQEVNENNVDLIEKIAVENNFNILKKFPIRIESINQYNIIMIKNEPTIEINKIFCLPHGKDNQYKNINEQVIDYNMSGFRTTLFVNFKYNNKRYLIGCIHTNYISTESEINGTLKSLNYMDEVDVDYKLIVGNMNMVSHMSEVYNILKQNNNYTTKSRNSNFNFLDNSWHGYETMELVNVDFAFVEKDKESCYEYFLIKQENMMTEGSDHRPIIMTIKDY